MNNEHKKAKFCQLLEVGLLVFIVCFIGMSLYCTQFINLMADDFSYIAANRSIQEQNPTLSYLHVELWSALNNYLHWQGTWFANILMYLLFGLERYGLAAFQILCFVIDLLFLLSLLFAVREVVQLFHIHESDKRFWWLFLIAAIIWAGFNTVSPAEELYWIDVVMIYTATMACGFAGIGFYLRFLRTGRRKVTLMVLAGLLGMLGCGGPLIGVAFFCAVYLLIAFVRWHDAHKLFSKDTFPFYLTLLGGLINALAPGNFIRHEAESGNTYQLWNVLWITLKDVVLRYKGLICSGFLIGICAIFIVIVWNRKEPLFPTRWNPLLLWGYTFFTVYITIFPFVLAYRLEDYLSDRVGYEVDLFAAILTILSVLYTAEWMKTHRLAVSQNAVEYGNCVEYAAAVDSIDSNQTDSIEIKNNIVVQRSDKAKKGKNAQTMICIVVIASNLFLNNWNYSVIPHQIAEVFSGECRGYYKTVSEIYAQIESSTESDVVISDELPVSRTLKMLDVRSWPEYWANDCLAQHYGQNSVVFEKADDTYMQRLLGQWD